MLWRHVAGSARGRHKGASPGDPQHQREQEELADLGKGAQLKPVLALIHAKSSPCTPLQKACLRAAVTGAVWPPRRLYDAGLKDTPSCEVCGEHGTAVHRPWRCSATAALRGSVDPATVRDAQAGAGSTFFWSRLLAPAAAALFPPPNVEGEV